MPERKKKVKYSLSKAVFSAKLRLFEIRWKRPYFHMNLQLIMQCVLRRKYESIVFSPSWRKQRIEISYRGRMPIEVMTDVWVPHLQRVARARRLWELAVNFHGFCVITLCCTNVKMNSEAGLIITEGRVSCKISKACYAFLLNVTLSFLLSHWLSGTPATEGEVWDLLQNASLPVLYHFPLVFPSQARAPLSESSSWQAAVPTASRCEPGFRLARAAGG